MNTDSTIPLRAMEDLSPRPAGFTRQMERKAQRRVEKIVAATLKAAETRGKLAPTPRSSGYFCHPDEVKTQAFLRRHGLPHAANVARFAE